MHIINSIKTVFYVVSFIFFFSFLVERQLFAEGFLHGTQVKTPIGYVAIEELQINDSVMCCDNAWSFTEQSVIALHKNKVTHYIKIMMGNESICVAADQKFYVPKEQIWCDAQYLMPGDVLLSNGSTLMTIDDVVNVDEEVMVYDIAVNDYHNFCVSSYDIHVHNVIPVITAGIGWVVGLGAAEIAQATLAVVGTAIAFLVSRNNDKQKAKMSSSNFGGQSNNGGPSEEDDPDDKKEKRDNARNNYRPLTNKEARQKAKELGYRETKNHPCPDTRNRPVFKNDKKNLYISPDIDGHNGGYWKMFNGSGRRIGTWNLNLTKQIGK